MPLFADGDCFARAARSAGTAGPKPLDNPTVGSRNQEVIGIRA